MAGLYDTYLKKDGNVYTKLQIYQLLVANKNKLIQENKLDLSF